MTNFNRPNPHEGPDTHLIARSSGDAEFLYWIYCRLRDKHGEDELVDYMHTLYDFVKKVPQLFRILDKHLLMAKGRDDLFSLEISLEKPTHPFAIFRNEPCGSECLGRYVNFSTALRRFKKL